MARDGGEAKAANEAYQAEHSISLSVGITSRMMILDRRLIKISSMRLFFVWSCGDVECSALRRFGLGLHKKMAATCRV
jgi:hypothetical protein